MLVAGCSTPSEGRHRRNRGSRERGTFAACLPFFLQNKTRCRPNEKQTNKNTLSRPSPSLRPPATQNPDARNHPSKTPTTILSWDPVRTPDLTSPLVTLRPSWAPRPLVGPSLRGNLSSKSKTHTPSPRGTHPFPSWDLVRTPDVTSHLVTLPTPRGLPVPSWDRFARPLEGYPRAGGANPSLSLSSGLGRRMKSKERQNKNTKQTNVVAYQTKQNQTTTKQNRILFEIYFTPI